MLHIAVNADCAGPSGFSFELIMTVSAGSCCIPRMRRLAGRLCAGVLACCNPNAGSAVAAAEAAPRMRINDLRETPCVVSEFIEGSPRKIDFVGNATPLQ